MFYQTVVAGKYSIFPKLVEHFSNEQDPELFDLVLEKMDPLIVKSGPSSFLSEHLWFETSAEALLKATKCTVELLNCLDILHSVYGIVHSRICPENVMYSRESKVWKLIDYEFATPISSRAARSLKPDKTTEYTSPESLESGAFTDASDVFALGKVIQDVLYFKLLNKFEMRERKNDLKYLTFLEFEAVLIKMTSKNPTDRISVRDALLQFDKILSKFRSHLDLNHPAYSRIRLICESFKSQEQQKKRLIVFCAEFKPW